MGLIDERWGNMNLRRREPNMTPTVAAHLGVYGDEAGVGRHQFVLQR